MDIQTPRWARMEPTVKPPRTASHIEKKTFSCWITKVTTQSKNHNVQYLTNSHGKTGYAKPLNVTLHVLCLSCTKLVSVSLLVSHTAEWAEGQAQRSIFAISLAEYTKTPDCNKVRIMRLGSVRDRTLKWRQTGSFLHIKLVLTRRSTTKLTV